MEIENLLQETLKYLKDQNLTAEDVVFVTDGRHSIGWDEFAQLADFEYEKGYGTEHIFSALKIVGENWWLERHEYDGREWWEFKALPEQKPHGQIKITEDAHNWWLEGRNAKS